LGRGCGVRKLKATGKSAFQGAAAKGQMYWMNPVSWEGCWTAAWKEQEPNISSNNQTRSI